MRASKAAQVQATADHLDWSQILVDAVNKPGVISTAYSAFWNYSVGNQLLALFECWARKIEPGPIHTFRGWLKLNRHVRKGEKAITLCMPVRVRRLSNVESARSADELQIIDAPHPTIESVVTRFVFRPNWFVLSQTDGDRYVPLVIPVWDEQLASHVLMIDREPFRHTNGNVQGYAHERRFAVSPIAYLPHRTMFHEMAHIMLGHTAESMGLSDTDDRTPRDLREVEAEAVSLICCQSLGLPGEAFSRGYLQHWLGKQVIENRTAQRVFHAADTILRAGRPDRSEERSEPPD